MGKTNRHEQTGDKQFKKLRGRTNKRKRNKNKASLSNKVLFCSQRYFPHQSNDESCGRKELKEKE